MWILNSWFHGKTTALDLQDFQKRLLFLSNEHSLLIWANMAYQIRSLIRPGRVAQSVTCLATDACLTADPGVASSILARSHTFV